MMSSSLFIIGNGFDLSHGMKTSWGDFLEWLSKQKEFLLLSNWLTFYPGFTAILWSNLEQALGEYDLEEQYEYCTRDIEIDYDHMMRIGFGIEDAPMSELSPVISQLQRAFVKWIHGIELPTREKQYLPEEARYLSFNYTSVLEQTYGIPSSQVFHIHGCVDNGDTLIFGHDNYVTEASSSAPDQVIFIEKAKASIIGIMNDLYKDVPSIIEENADYFAGLADIERITVLGHSYNPIDIPYFKAIAENVKPDCYWILSYHNEADKIAAKAMIANLGTDPSKCELVRF